MEVEIAGGHIVRVPVATPRPRGRPRKGFEPGVEEKPSVNIFDIRKNPVYLAMTPGQQQFLEKFLETKDRMQASQHAYPGIKNHDVNALRVLRNPGVRKLVGLFFGQDPISLPLTRKELISLISGRIRSANSDEAFVKLVDMYMRLTGGYKKKVKDEAVEPEADEEQDLDELVRKLEAKKEK